MPRFTYDDVVRTVTSAPVELRPGARSNVIAVFETRPKGSHFAAFPDGVIYSVEFEDGEAIDVHEAYLEPVE
ncbi:hypothetical protein [Brevundimonas sp. GCM10030266]|uniref:hypothetical protein n=1 Tax=Brevundimonas sp. GCM10030266 TaxID=3273386 RepID=UPI00360B7FA9